MIFLYCLIGVLVLLLLLLALVWLDKKGRRPMIFPEGDPRNKVFDKKKSGKIRKLHPDIEDYERDTYHSIQEEQNN
jgi:hypothetical protein